MDLMILVVVLLLFLIQVDELFIYIIFDCETHPFCLKICLIVPLESFDDNMVLKIVNWIC